MKNISAIDLVIIVLYLAGIVGAGVWVGLRKRKGGEAGSYFLAGNTLGWTSIGLALFATNISCLHLVSLAQAGYDSGFLMGNFEWLAAYKLIALSLFFVPFYMRATVSTLPDFLEKNTDFFLQIFDHALLVAIHPAIDADHQKSKRINRRRMATPPSIRQHLIPMPNLLKNAASAAKS